jgi:hypothetical protein
MSEPIKWTNVTLKLSQLKKWENNPAEISKEAAGRLVECFNEFGQIETLAVDPENRLVDGHQRLDTWLAKYGDIEVDCRKASRLLTEKERQKIAVMLRSGAVGRYNWDVVSGWNADDLQGWGMNSATLKDWKRDITALNELINSEKTHAGKEPDFIELGIRKTKWNFKNRKGFLSLRVFDTNKKNQQMEYLKQIKSNGLFVEEIASEFSKAITNTFGNVNEYCITSAPEHKTGFAKLISMAISEILGIKHVDLYKTEIDKNASRAIFQNRCNIELNCDIPKKIIWIDDTLTTGITLSSCRDLVEGNCFVPIVWIYDDAVE